MIEQTLPDGRTVGYGYGANASVTAEYDTDFRVSTLSVNGSWD